MTGTPAWGRRTSVWKTMSYKEGETLERRSKGVFDVALSLAIPVAYLVGNKCRCRTEFGNTVISDLC